MTRIEPAAIVFDDDGTPQAPAFGDRYHPRGGAAPQARAVFLAGNGLPGRWAGRTDFTLLETGFGLGLNFLATWRAWRADPQRPQRLHYVAIDAHPPGAADLTRAHAASEYGAGPEAAALRAAWPPPVPGLHAIDLDGGRVQLLLAWGDVATVARELDVAADALFLDGFAPARNPAMWSPALLQTLARRLRPGATAATWTVARAVREGLRAAGFEVERVAGVGAKRESLRAVLAPRFELHAPPPRGGAAERHAVVLGAGLAGAWAAHALARQGWTVTVLDRHATPAQEASGNPAGLYHASVPADDAPHGQLLRAAALRSARWMAPWIDGGALPGRADGLLRRTGDALPALHAHLARLGLPPACLQSLDAAQAATIAGPGALAGPAAAWWFEPQGGWVDPGALVRRLLQTPGVGFRGDSRVQALVRDGTRWALLDAAGQPLARAGTVVLANAAEAARLWPQAGWPLARGRGQVSWWRPAPCDAPQPAVPLAGDGYAITLPGAGLLCGATRQAGDDDNAVRDGDHDFNRQRLARLTGWHGPVPSGGRVGWRVQAADRLPLAGPVAAQGAGVPAGPNPLRRLAREPGLHVLTGFGARGITWGPLMAEVLAAWITGAPMPVASRHRDAVDPARWLLRAARQGARGPAS